VSILTTNSRYGFGDLAVNFVGRHVFECQADFIQDGEIPFALLLSAVKGFEIAGGDDSGDRDAAFLNDDPHFALEDAIEHLAEVLPGI